MLRAETHTAMVGLSTSIHAAVSLSTRSYVQSTGERSFTFPCSQGQYASDRVAESILTLVIRTISSSRGASSSRNKMPNCPKCNKPVYFGKITITTTYLLSEKSKLISFRWVKFVKDVLCAHRREQSSFVRLQHWNLIEIIRVDLQIE